MTFMSNLEKVLDGGDKRVPAVHHQVDEILRFAQDDMKPR